MKTIDLIECQEILEERKRHGFNMVDMETAESLLWHYQTESQLCLENAKIASEALKENAKLKEALYSMVRITPEWDEDKNCLYCGTPTGKHMIRCSLQVAKELVKDIDNEND